MPKEHRRQTGHDLPILSIHSGIEIVAHDRATVDLVAEFFRNLLSAWAIKPGILEHTGQLERVDHELILMEPEPIRRTPAGSSRQSRHRSTPPAWC
jgi:hypothetical protein